ATSFLRGLLGSMFLFTAAVTITVARSTTVAITAMTPVSIAATVGTRTRAVATRGFSGRRGRRARAKEEAPQLHKDTDLLGRLGRRSDGGYHRDGRRRRQARNRRCHDGGRRSGSALFALGELFGRGLRSHRNLVADGGVLGQARFVVTDATDL